MKKKRKRRKRNDSCLHVVRHMWRRKKEKEEKPEARRRRELIWSSARRRILSGFFTNSERETEIHFFVSFLSRYLLFGRRRRKRREEKIDWLKWPTSEIWTLSNSLHLSVIFLFFSATVYLVVFFRSLGIFFFSSLKHPRRESKEREDEERKITNVQANSNTVGHASLFMCEK